MSRISYGILTWKEFSIKKYDRKRVSMTNACLSWIFKNMKTAPPTKYFFWSWVEFEVAGFYRIFSVFYLDLNCILVESSKLNKLIMLKKFTVEAY